MKRKKLLPVVLTVVLILSLSITALAISGQKTIAVTFNNIKLMIDGKTFTPKDALGNIVEPFAYNGTTYVPIRAVGEALHKQVAWDSQTATVVIGGEGAWLDEMPAYQFSSSTDGAKYQSIGKTEIYHGASFERGVKIDHRIPGDVENEGITETTTLSYLLSGTYSHFYATLDAQEEYYFDPTILKVYGDGKVLYTSPAFTCESIPYDIDVDVSGVSVLTIECKSVGQGNWCCGNYRLVILGDARFTK